VLPVNGVTHTVKRGDNIITIAQRYRTEANKILSHNNLSPNDIIGIGDVLVIPDGRPHVPISPSVTPSAPIHSLANISGYFGLPSRGRITQGLHLYNAVDVGGSNYCNTPIYASAAGTVITSKTSGWNGGYGKYIKISHPNSTVTLYAHNSQNLVSSGQYVSKGQIIALMGATGRTTGCHVHFETRGARNPFVAY
jgi:LysM repeat protein